MIENLLLIPVLKIFVIIEGLQESVSMKPSRNLSAKIKVSVLKSQTRLGAPALSCEIL